MEKVPDDLTWHHITRHQDAKKAEAEIASLKKELADAIAGGNELHAKRDALQRNYNILEAELASLKAWKEDAMHMLLKYDAIAESVGGLVGTSKVENLAAELARLREVNAKLLDACKLLVATAGSYLEGLEVGCDRHELSAEESQLYNAINDAKEVIAQEKPNAR